MSPFIARIQQQRRCVIPDLDHWWGEDLKVSNSGDLALIDGVDRGSQRIIRRLMTIAGAYIWHVEYGGSLPIRIGETLDASVIESIIRFQTGREAAVARVPPPTITITPVLGGVFVSIKYVDADTGLQTALQFDVST